MTVATRIMDIARTYRIHPTFRGSAKINADEISNVMKKTPAPPDSIAFWWGFNPLNQFIVFIPISPILPPYPG
jgi:hypothetical protein